MVLRRFDRWINMEEWMADMEDLMHHIMECGPMRYPVRYFPETGIGRRMFPQSFSDLRADVRDHGDEIIVTADLPGVGKEDISIKLIDPVTLQISCQKKEETVSADEEKNYYMQERIYGNVSRNIPLPAEVGFDDAVATYNNGVVEVRLKKIVALTAREISIT